MFEVWRYSVFPFSYEKFRKNTFSRKLSNQNTPSRRTLLKPSLRKDGTSCSSHRQVCTVQQQQPSPPRSLPPPSSPAALLVSCTQLDTIELMRRRILQRRGAPELRSLREVFDKRGSDRKRDKTITRPTASRDNSLKQYTLESTGREARGIMRELVDLRPEERFRPEKSD